MLSSSACRRLPSSALRYYSSKSCQRTFTTTSTTTSSNGTNNASTTAVAGTASTLANNKQKKQHQLFLLNRVTMAAKTTSRSNAKPATATGTTSASTPSGVPGQQQQAQPVRHFHSYSSSSSFQSRRTFTSTSTAQQSQGSQQTSQQQQQQGPKRNRTFLEWYEGHLEAHPVITKMFTGSLLWGIGDAVAQVVPQVAFNNEEDEKKEKPEQSAPPAAAAAAPSLSLSTLTYDWPRTGRAALFGFALHAPTSHVHFNFLEWLTHRVGVTGAFGIPIFKAFMEQFVYWSWISNSMYHGAMGAMQGMTLQQIYNRIADVLWETQKAQWVFWIPVQLLNFRFVPVRHQLNVVLVTSIVWTALLSVWYPPQDDNDKKKDNDEEKKVKENAEVEAKA